MEHLETIQQLKRYFALSELVGKDVYAKYGDFAWAFFDPRLLEVLLWLREGLGVPLVCNTKALQERGLRGNLSQQTKKKTAANDWYFSAHCLGKGVDLSSGSMTAANIRRWVRANIASCPHPIRLEGDKSAPTWVHIDVMNITNNKLQEFNV